jgi:hypothetical protein
MDTTLPPPPASPPKPPPTPSPSPSPSDDDATDRSRAGAIWVTGTGAFLLLAAAAVFVAVRWDHLGDQVKLAILGALTGGFLLAGRRVRRELPATGGVLFHLGALLIPLNTATIAIHAELVWNQVLVLEGLTATCAWFLLDRVERSIVLRWAAGGAFVVTVAGVAATIGAPTPLPLAGAALVAHVRRAPKPALWWATIAGLGPVIVFAESWLSGSEVAQALGLAPTAPGLVWVLSGAIAATVIGREAQRRGEALLIVPAGASLVIGIAATWSILDPSAVIDVVGAAGAFLTLEIAAGLTRRDPFWRGATHGVAVAAETIALAVAPIAIVATAWWFVDGRSITTHQGELAAAALLTAGAWLVGDLRRIAGANDGPTISWAVLLGSGWWPATCGITAYALVGVALLSGSSLAVGAAMVAFAAIFVLTGRPAGHAAATVLAILAPLFAGFDVITADGVNWTSTWFELAPGAAPSLALIAVLGVTGAIVLAAAAVVRARLVDPIDNRPLAWSLAVAALGPIATASAVLAGEVDALVVLVGAAIAGWAVALVLDAGEPGGPDQRGVTHLGMVGRAGAVLTLVGSGAVGARGTIVLAGLVSLALVGDAVRRRSEVPILGLAVTLPVLVGAAAADLGLTTAEIGVALTLLAAVAAGAHLLIGDGRGWPLIGVVVSAGASGFGLAATTSTTGWLAVLVLAGVGAAYAMVSQSLVGGAVCGLAAIIATWGLLVDGRVEVFDAYLAPVALALVVAGGLARRSNRVSSWVAYSPAIVLLGGSALYERVVGGGGIHAIVAGAVALVAVIAGGSRRLAAPLLLGTALLVGITAHESLAVTRQVPTWGWLALGGAALVGAGIAMERRDTGPMETGRRLVDVVGTRFH